MGKVDGFLVTAAKHIFEIFVIFVLNFYTSDGHTNMTGGPTNMTGGPTYIFTESAPRSTQS